MKKQLFAVYIDSQDVSLRLPVAEGETGDFASPMGFVIPYSPEHGLPTEGAMYPTLAAGDFSHLEGQILTLLEAVLPDKKQQESTKSLARNILWDWFSARNLRLQEVFKSTK